MNENQSSIVVGDSMRISVALIEQIRDGGPENSIVAVVKKIVVEEDGTKTLWLERAH